MEYNHSEIEKRWQKEWADKKTFAAQENSTNPKFYSLDMFPYPSGAGLHVGHPLGYIASDIYSRYKRLKGYNVLHPMGYDSFGLPAEQYAIQTGQHPAVTTKTNVERYRQQMDQIGFSFDWDREVRTSSPEYYKWTQWIFKQLFNSWYNKASNKAEKIETLTAVFETEGSTNVKASCAETETFTADQWSKFTEKEQSDILMNYRLAFISDTMVNWCPALGTVLANDEIKDGVSERGGHPVVQKLMRQWSMRITAYAERLIQGLDTIDWSDSIKEQQKNWIGKSKGAMVSFPILNPSPGEGLASQSNSAGSSSTAGYMTGGNYSHLLLEKAKEMRANPTEAEAFLWAQLKGKQLGVKFRQQHLIDDFIADFVCLSKTLIIEVDGKIHDSQKEQDEARTAVLENLEYKVIRFTNEEVLMDIENVLKKIKKELAERPDVTSNELANKNEPEIISEPVNKSEPANTSKANVKVLPLGKDLGWDFIEVFTTRPDTIFGVNFMVLAPEHELVAKITTPEQKEEVEAYIEQASLKTERDRQADVKNITGVNTGAFAIHPFTGEKVQIWIGDYVLAGYGTGAVMAVPAGDQRDWAFATHFGIEIKNIFENVDISEGACEDKSAILTNSDFLNGLNAKQGIGAAIKAIQEKGCGRGMTNFRLRDAIFSRQRYWGEPFPVYFENEIPKVIEDEFLPIELPEVEKYLPTEDGDPPLGNAKEWYWDNENKKIIPTPSLPKGDGEFSGKDSFVFNDFGYRTANPAKAKILLEFAKEMRKNPTPAEKVMWDKLRNQKLGAKFRRQHYFGDFIVDFVCLRQRLVIEVDGDIHDYQKEYDAERTAILEKNGLKVMRFRNEEVLNNTEQVLKTIKSELDRDSLLSSSKAPLPSEGAGGRLELNTMPGWAGSSWYFLRYMDPKNEGEFVSKEKADYWGQVDLYIGGAEHATGHLLYSRFWTKFLYDMDYISFEEPFKKLINQGMILGRSSFVYSLVRSNSKNYSLPPLFISKNKFDLLVKAKNLPRKLSKEEHETFLEARNIENEINNKTQEILLKDGQLTGRIQYLNKFPMQLPVDINFVKNDILDQEAFKNWRPEYANAEFITNENGDYICGSEVEKMSKSKYNVQTPDELVEKFGADTLRCYEMFLGPLEQAKPWDTNGITGVNSFLKKLWRLFHSNEEFAVSKEPASKESMKSLHTAIKKVTEDLERYSFNTIVSGMMILVNELSQQKCNHQEVLEKVLVLASPYAPHICEELWNKLGHTESISFATWPEFNPEFLIEANHNYPISFNGKMRFMLELPSNMAKEDIEKEVLAHEKTACYLEGKQPKKVIIVPKKIVNIVL